MYSNPAPIFDVPEFPSLRRIKPLPKRRRTSDTVPGGFADLIPSALSLTETIADELAAAFSTPLALDQYFANVSGFSANRDFRRASMNSQGLKHSGSIFTLGSGRTELNGDGNDVESGEMDYVEHLRQPGNTKKRKVPQTSIAPNVGDGLSVSGDEDQQDRNVSPRFDTTTPLEFDTSPQPTYLPSQRKGKLSRASQALIQHKELLNIRKRQLTAVIDALSEGNPLALEQALSSNSLWSKGFTGDIVEAGNSSGVQLSRHAARRGGRTAKANGRALTYVDSNTTDTNDPFPSMDFTFRRDCATSEHVRKTKEEVAALQSRFEVELSRQTAKAARQVAQRLQKAKRGDYIERSMRTGTALSHGRGNEETLGIMDRTLNSKTKTKKKKRSAMANASNPHHLRNYVPSRLPNTGPTHATPQDSLFPVPLRFLSADIPRRKKKASEQNVTPMSHLINPEDEWICPLCEYKLFYGDEQGRRRAVRSRKKILARRRRARERAAAAASGRKAIAPLGNSGSVLGDDDVADDFADGTAPNPPAANAVLDRDRGEDGGRHKDRGRGSSQLG